MKSCLKGFSRSLPIKDQSNVPRKVGKVRKDRYNLKSCAFWDTVIFYVPRKRTYLHVLFQVLLGKDLS